MYAAQTVNVDQVERWIHVELTNKIGNNATSGTTWEGERRVFINNEMGSNLDCWCDQCVRSWCYMGKHSIDLGNTSINVTVPNTAESVRCVLPSDASTVRLYCMTFCKMHNCRKTEAPPLRLKNIYSQCPSAYLACIGEECFTWCVVSDTPTGISNFAFLRGRGNGGRKERHPSEVDLMLIIFSFLVVVTA
ncbi:hypothetical protein PoB_003317000 [Plakobranchus ocellatus]|uniref:Uncharacterized protein n=1 Tax=Plakobranchus ocellatus TaxID=259542 RepID=A0AAV4AH30_9GAST|nr:hypothetical protein PoB_003317000 [Plakobranchus ocellatus]